MCNAMGTINLVIVMVSVLVLRYFTFLYIKNDQFLNTRFIYCTSESTFTSLTLHKYSIKRNSGAAIYVTKWKIKRDPSFTSNKCSHFRFF